MCAKALLTFRITVDRTDRRTPVHVHIKLYREDGELIWRLNGDIGDECETLPRPPTVAHAKADARAAYPPHSPFKPAAAWM